VPPRMTPTAKHAHQGAFPGGKNWPGTRATPTSERTLPRSIVNRSERAPACAACDQRWINPKWDMPRRSLESKRSRRSPTASGLACPLGDDQLRATTGYDCRSAADAAQNGATTKSPRTPCTTDTTRAIRTTGSEVPSRSQSMAASRFMEAECGPPFPMMHTALPTVKLAQAGSEAVDSWEAARPVKIDMSVGAVSPNGHDSTRPGSRFRRPVGCPRPLPGNSSAPAGR
jgi:hypothetical protein